MRPCGLFETAAVGIAHFADFAGRARRLPLLAKIYKLV